MADRIKEFMHVEKAANYLQCTKKHVYELIKSGDIEAIRSGERAIRVSKESLAAFIKRQKIEPDTYLCDYRWAIWNQDQYESKGTIEIGAAGLAAKQSSKLNI